MSVTAIRRNARDRASRPGVEGSAPIDGEGTDLYARPIDSAESNNGSYQVYDRKEYGLARVNGDTRVKKDPVKVA